MTENELAFMFNHHINSFFLEKNVFVYREKRHGKKYFGLIDCNTYTEEEVNSYLRFPPVCEFRTLGELLDFEYKGKTLRDWISPLTELIIDNDFGDK